MHILEVAQTVALLLVGTEGAAVCDKRTGTGQYLHFRCGVGILKNAGAICAGDLYAVALCDLLGQGKVLQ